MPLSIREISEQREVDSLSKFATLAVRSEGRELSEEQDPIRTCFQRDRDRVLHSKSFRRLKHKTQVFIAPQGDHYRTRLTHSLEVAQVSRTIGRALRLNEDLIEAIALSHDVGHTPFGHIGENALNEVVKDQNDPLFSGFRHYEQSLRIVDKLEKLNLTSEVRAGISGHSKGRNDLTAFDGEPTSTLEAAVVRISDRIAYMNHDLDDAIRSGIITDYPEEFGRMGRTQGKRIGFMVENVISHSLDQPAIRISPELLVSMNNMKEWLFDNVYFEYPNRYPDIHKAENVVKDLFEHFLVVGNLPEAFKGIQGAIDYVAGMTDRFAIETYAKLKLPEGFQPIGI